MKKLLICLLIFLTSKIYAQQAEVIGVVRDAISHESIPGATVLFSGTASGGTVTDSSGRFTLKLDTGDYTLVFSFISYESASKKISMQNGDAKILNIDLTGSSKELSTVVVSAGKFEQRLEEVTVSMAVVKKQHIENVNTNTMETLMEEIPGVTVIDGQPNIRGGSGFSYGAGSRVLVLVDDLPMLAADANDPKWSFLPVEITEQVEVLKGASSSLFGSAALNGVMNFRTINPTSKPESAFTLYSGIYDTPRRKEIRWWNKERFVSGFNLSHARKLGRLDLVVGGHYLKDEGYRMGETEEKVRGNIKTRYHFNFLPGLSAGINANVQQAKGGNYLLWNDDTTGAYIPQGGLDTGTTTISYYTTTRTNIDPFITYTGIKGNHKLRSRYFKINNQNNTNQQSQAIMYYGEYQYQRMIGSILTLTGGVSYLKNDVTSELYGNHKQENASLFGQADLKYRRLNVSIGGRYENFVNDTLNAVHKSIVRYGLNYHFFKATYLRASYGQGFRYPSIGEQFIRTQVGKIVIYNNDSLKPESGWTSEIGVKQLLKLNSWVFDLDAARFWSEYKDMMEFSFGHYGKPSSPFYGLGFKSLNIGNTRITGYDFSLSGKGKVYGLGILFSVAYTEIKPIKKDFNPAIDPLNSTANYNVLKYRYRKMWKIDGEISFRHISIGLSARYYSFMENIDAVFQEPILGVYAIPGVKRYRQLNNGGNWIYDWRASYQIQKNTTISCVIKNCFNHEWATRPADLQPPRTYNLQVSVKF